MNNYAPPRVSDVLKILFPDSLKYVPSSALERGRDLHEYIEFYINSIIAGVAPPSLDNYSEDRRMRIQAMLSWFKKANVIAKSSEERFSHQLGFVGHPDIIGTMGQRPLCIEMKFADTITLSNFVQAEAYGQLTKLPVVLVQCASNGAITLHRCKPRADLWMAFMSALNVVKFHRANRPTLPSEEELLKIKEELCQT